MEFAKDMLDALHAKAHAATQGAGITGFDWQGLHARLSAGHAARRELIRSDSRAPLVAGGFDDWKLAGANPAQISPCVNPADSTDGKAGQGITNHTVETIQAGG